MDGEKPASFSLGTAGFGSDELLAVGCPAEQYLGLRHTRFECPSSVILQSKLSPVDPITCKTKSSAYATNWKTDPSIFLCV